MTTCIIVKTRGKFKARAGRRPHVLYMYSQDQRQVQSKGREKLVFRVDSTRNKEMNDKSDQNLAVDCNFFKH